MTFLAAFFFAIVLALTGCNDARLNDPVDSVKNLSREDFQDLRRDVPERAGGPPIPRLSLKTERPSLSRLGSDRIISLAVTEKVPLKDVLMELASKADVNIELDPRITGGVIFSATNQPFSRVLERLCALAGLRYSVEDHFLRVELDEPYLKTYPIDYLTLVRRANSEIGIATNVFSNIQSGRNNANTNNDAGSGNNSTTKVNTAALADFWAEVEGNIESILANTKQTRSLRSDIVQEMKQEGVSPAKPFTINKQAGLITVFGSERQQKAISAYVDKVKRNVNAQVLIEARIIEVQLDEAYKSGINWRSLLGHGIDAAARFGTAATGAPFATAGTATDGVVTLSMNTSDFAGVLNFVRSFGTARTLSSPRLTVMNNQPAVLKVARNEVYFTSTIETTPIIGTSGGSPVAVQRTVNSTPNTVPVGFLMTVQPSINLEKEDVTLNLRPTISFIVDRVEDPGVRIAAADANVTGVSSSIPVVAVREMDSVLTMHSGSVAVMGGLMQDSSGNLEKGVPYADNIPIFGNLAKSRDEKANVTELVILLRATLVDGSGTPPDDADKELYHRFTQDRRPLPIASPVTRKVALPDVSPEVEEQLNAEKIQRDGEKNPAVSVAEKLVAQEASRGLTSKPTTVNKPVNKAKTKTPKHLSTHKYKKNKKHSIKKKKQR